MVEQVRHSPLKSSQKGIGEFYSLIVQKGGANTNSRRTFLKHLLAGIAGSPLSSSSWLSCLAIAQRSGKFPFELVPSATSRITWVHRNGRSPEMYLPETVGAGCAFIDYDNDGWMDIFLVNSGKCDFFDPQPPLRNALYRNNRDGTFTDVTEKAGVGGSGYGMGVAVGDYDGDGLPDLLVTQYNGVILYHNNGDGTFTDVTRKAGLPAKGWASSAVWLDYDNDGKLDLFVCRFVDFDKSKNKFCGNRETDDRYYCIPRDYDQDGWMDLFVTNVDQEMYSLYHNNRDETFDDMAIPYGIGKVTLLMSGWGVKFFDYDNDGTLDLFLANGHPDDKIQEHSSEVKYREPMLLFHGTGRGFENVTAGSGPVFSKPYAARGMAVGDFNNDGALDVLVAINNGSPLLLKNQVGRQNHWLGVRLVAKRANPDAVGALITWQAGDLK